MTAEIVDYFLIFWVVLAGAVFLVGSFYERQQRERRRKLELQEAKRARLERDSAWAGGSPSAVQTHFEDSSYRSTAATATAPNYYSSPRVQQPHYQQQQQQLQQQQHQQYHQQQQYQYGVLDGPAYLPASYATGQQQQVGGLYDGRSLALADEADELELRARRSAQHYADPDSGAFAFADAELTAATEPSSIPTASGFNADCVEWVNAILYLFYASSHKYGPIIGESVYRSLNEKLSSLTSASSEHSHLLVEFEGVNVNSSSRPELTNVRTESESDKSVSATCKIYNRRISLNLSIRRLLGPAGLAAGELNTPSSEQQQQQQQQHHNQQRQSRANEGAQRYELVLENLEGKLKSMAMLGEKLIVIQFIEKPDTKILLRPLTIIRGSGASAHAAREPLISEDALVQLILQTLTQVVVDLYFGTDLDFPQYRAGGQNHALSSTYATYKSKFNNIFKGSASELKRQIKHDFFGALTGSQQHKERKVLVKIFKAKNINYNQNVTCLLELDAPRQQAVSSTRAGSPSEPLWDEHFLFSVSDKSRELTIELWDSLNTSALVDSPAPSGKTSASANTSTRWHHKADLTAGANFLGLARVHMDELRRNPVQRVSLSLEPLGASEDPNNSVGGELQLELLFMEHSAGDDPASSSAAAPAPSASALHKSYSVGSLARCYQQGDIVSIDRKLTPSGYVITTTTITKAAPERRAPDASARQRQQQLLAAAARNQSPGGGGGGSSSVNTAEEGRSFDGGASSPEGPREPGTASPGGRSSRPRSRSRSFIRAIRKRLSFSRTRSRSVGGDESPAAGLDATPQDYESRSRASSVASGVGAPADARAKSMPASRDPSEVPTIVINRGGRLSDTTAAAPRRPPNPFTFAQPKSQLVIEVIEPGLREQGNERARDHVRHYAVPADAASQRKWRKRGLKLHVFNEHQFVACHLAGSSTCHLCGRVFSRRPGKQGYKCRNCHLLSHKECHVKVDHICPYAQRDGLRLEFIDAEPPASLVDEIMLHNSSSNNNGNESAHSESPGPAPGAAFRGIEHHKPVRRARPSRSGLKSTAKSISMEVDDR